MENSSSKKTIAIAIIASFIINFIINGAVYFLFAVNIEVIEDFVAPFFINFAITSIGVYMTTFIASFFTSKGAKKYLEKGLLTEKESKGLLSNISKHPFYFAVSIIGIFIIPASFLLAGIFTPIHALVDPRSSLDFLLFRTNFRAVASGIYGAFVSYLVLRRAQIK